VFAISQLLTILPCARLSGERVLCSTWPVLIISRCDWPSTRHSRGRGRPRPRDVRFWSLKDVCGHPYYSLSRYVAFVTDSLVPPFNSSLAGALAGNIAYVDGVHISFTVLRHFPIISLQHHPRCFGRDNGCVKSSCCVPYVRSLLASWIYHRVCAVVAICVSEALVLTAYFRSPLIGGSLSHPAKHFALFQRIPFFTMYPYALPCLISGVISLGAAMLGCFCLEEVCFLNLFFDV
jgi:hypothetical protein